MIKKKYKILPKQALINRAIMIVLCFGVLYIMEKNMIPYAEWGTENKFINKDRMEKMEDIKSEGYPLINLKSSDVAQGEKKKIMVIGDSFIEGHGYSNMNQTWWRQLELELHDRGYYDVEVLGVGTDGASTYDEMNWLSKTNLIEDTQPDLIMIGYVINDPEIDDKDGNSIVKQATSINYFKTNKILETFSNFFPNISYKLNNMIGKKINRNKEYNDETGYPTSTWHQVIVNEKWSKVYNEKAVKPLGNYLKTIETPSFVITTPHGTGKEFETSYRVALPFFEEAGIKTYDMYSDFKEMLKNMTDEENKKINIANSHPGTAYTKFYAEYISDILERDYKEVLGEKYQEKITYPICINDWVPYALNVQTIEEEKDQVTYQITYPKKNNMLSMPLNKKYIKLSLEYPISIEEIQIEGETLNNAEVYVTTINEELGYDDQSMKLLGKKKGSKQTYQLNKEDLVTSICIYSNLSQKDLLTITIKR